MRIYAEELEDILPEVDATFEARAVIEAMREPTDAMVDAGMTELSAFQAYRIMIDAALGE